MALVPHETNHSLTARRCNSIIVWQFLEQIKGGVWAYKDRKSSIPIPKMFTELQTIIYQKNESNEVTWSIGGMKHKD